MGLRISDEAFAYLKIQKGRLEPLAEDRGRWQDEYEADLRRTFTELLPFLPDHCWGILDIGSGLGGIDLYLYRHYVELAKANGAKPGSCAIAGPWVNLLDGEDDAPEMRLHRETFNSMRVARDFLTSNGLRGERFAYYTPNDGRDFVKPYDLVLSLGSWCFHYAPEVYLPRLLSGGGLHSDSVLIVDLRRDKPDWIGQLRAAGFVWTGVARRSPKFDRVVLGRR